MWQWIPPENELGADTTGSFPPLLVFRGSNHVGGCGEKDLEEVSTSYVSINRLVLMMVATVLPCHRAIVPSCHCLLKKEGAAKCKAQDQSIYLRFALIIIDVYQRNWRFPFRYQLSTGAKWEETTNTSSIGYPSSPSLPPSCPLQSYPQAMNVAGTSSRPHHNCLSTLVHISFSPPAAKVSNKANSRRFEWPTIIRRWESNPLEVWALLEPEPYTAQTSSAHLALGVSQSCLAKTQSTCVQQGR